MPPFRMLGDLEKQAMDFLWKHAPATSEDVRTALGAGRTLTDSTIRTVLRRLEGKGFVRHRMVGRQFVYSTVREPRRVAVETVREVLKRFCRGSVEELLTGLVDHRVLDSAELRRIAEQIEAQERRRTKS